MAIFGREGQASGIRLPRRVSARTYADFATEAGLRSFETGLRPSSRRGAPKSAKTRGSAILSDHGGRLSARQWQRSFGAGPRFRLDTALN